MRSYTNGFLTIGDHGRITDGEFRGETAIVVALPDWSPTIYTVRRDVSGQEVEQSVLWLQVID